METVRYVGDPFVDAGVAVLEHWLEKACEEFTESDLETAAKRLQREYGKKIWRGYLTMHLPNSAWCNANIGDGRRDELIALILRGYKRELLLTPARPCNYCGRPGQVIADRSRAPLVTSETSMSFGPGGTPGTPVCGYCLYSIQFYPICSLKVSRKSLFWTAADSQWTFRLTGEFLKIVEQVTAGATDELVSLRWPSTLLLRAASAVIEDWSRAEAAERPALCDIVGCHTTNFGTQADYEELRIPKGLLEFWANAGSFGDVYERIVGRAWEENKAGKKRRGESSLGTLDKRNLLYEALGDAFRSADFITQAKRVVARFFLGPSREAPPRGLFALTVYFLEKVAGMERARLDAIERIADRIAENISRARIDRDLFARNMSLGQLVNYFARLQRKLAEIEAPLNWHEVLLALGITNEEDRTARDFWLVQDLILIRVYERLGKSVAEEQLPSLDPLTTDALEES